MEEARQNGIASGNPDSVAASTLVKRKHCNQCRERQSLILCETAKLQPSSQRLFLLPSLLLLNLPLFFISPSSYLPTFPFPSLSPSSPPSLPPPLSASLLPSQPPSFFLLPPHLPPPNVPPLTPPSLNPLSSLPLPPLISPTHSEITSFSSLSTNSVSASARFFSDNRVSFSSFNCSTSRDATSEESRVRRFAPEIRSRP